MTTENLINNIQSEKKEIEISSIEKTLAMGGPFLVKVRYLNGTQHKLVFTEPAKTWEVNLVFDYHGNEDEMPFGRIISYQDERVRRKIVEEADTITLEANGVYEFDYDIGQRWPHLLRPGKNGIYIKDYSDDSQTILSNKIFIHVLIDKSTYGNMLSILEDGTSTYESRVFASSWISKIFPDFKFLANAKTDEEKKVNLNDIQKAKSWWNAHKTDSNVVNYINGLNNAH